MSQGKPCCMSATNRTKAELTSANAEHQQQDNRQPGATQQSLEKDQNQPGESQLLNVEVLPIPGGPALLGTDQQMIPLDEEAPQKRND